MSYKPGRLAVAAASMSIAMTAVPIGPVHAGLVPTDRLIAAHDISADRERVASFLAREDVQKRLSEYGVNPAEASMRVAALSDREIGDIASRLDALPAGQDGGATIIGAAVTIFLVLLITDILCFTSVFNFTRCAR